MFCRDVVVPRTRTVSRYRALFKSYRDSTPYKSTVCLLTCGSSLSMRSSSVRSPPS